MFPDVEHSIILVDGVPAGRFWLARLESGRRDRAKAALQRIADTPNLSRDVHDIAKRALAES